MRRPPHRGLSLMEVILAIAILGGSLATIGQLIRIGARAAAQARDLTMAQLYAESEMNRLSSGADLLDAVQDAKYDDAGLYTYSVDVMAAQVTGLMEVTVTVKQTPGTTAHPVSYTLSRWIVDPEYAQELADQEAAMKQAFADAQAANTSAETSGSATADASATSPAGGAIGGGGGQKGGNQQGKGSQKGKGGGNAKGAQGKGGPPNKGDAKGGKGGPQDKGGKDGGKAPPGGKDSTKGPRPQVFDPNQVKDRPPAPPDRPPDRPKIFRPK